MPKIKLDKQSIIFIILAGILLAELGVLLPWSVNRIVTISKRITTARNNLVQIEKDWPNKDKYTAQQAALSAEIAALREKLVGVDDESKLLSFISQTGKEYGVEIQSMSPSAFAPYPDDSLGSFNYFPIEIRARSRYHNLAQFFEFIQRSSYFFEVKDFSIKPSTPYNTIEMTICGLSEKK